MKKGNSFTAQLALWYMPIFYGMCFFAGSYMQLRYFVLNDVDFSYFFTQPWRIWTFGDWDVPFSREIDGAPFYAHHFTPLSLFLSPFFGFIPSEYTLSFIHASCCTAVAFLLPRLAREICLSENPQWLWNAIVILLLFFFFRPFITAWSRQTHYTTLGAPFLALACYYLHTRKIFAVFLCAIIVCCCQERASVAIFGLGMYAFILLKMHKTGFMLCILSAIWFFGATFLILPYFRHLAGLSNESYAMLDRIGLWTDWNEKSIFLFRLCAFCCFLPFCGRRALVCAICAMPNLAMAFVSARPGMYDLKGQYEDLPAIFLLLSMIYGMIWLQAKLKDKQWKALFLGGVIIYYCVLIPANTSWYNPLFTTIRYAFSPGRQDLDKLNDKLDFLKKNIPANSVIYVQSGLGPRLGFFKERLLLRKQIFEKNLKKSLLIFSPFCGVHGLGLPYAYAVNLAEKHPDLELIINSDDLIIFAGHDFIRQNPEFAKRLQMEFSAK